MAAALDSSVLIAGLLPWHEHHDRARAVLRNLLLDPRHDARAILPVHALIETYSVLTRLPAPYRLQASSAFELIEGLVRGRLELAQLEADAVWPLLERLRDDEVIGGAVYDALIVETARAAGADHLVTLNRSDFDRVAPSALAVTEPDALP